MNMIPTGKLKFEVPYNFDRRAIDLLQYFSVPSEYISYMYMIPFPQDYLASFRNNEYQLWVESLTRQEYESQIDYIKQKGYGKRLMLLLQRPNILLNKTQLQYYINLGFTGFCVGSIEQAKIIKEIDNNLYILGSILMKINLEKIKENFEVYLKYFDGFVLYFPFNRNLDKIKELPKNFKYTLLVNCACSAHCPGTPHWLYGDNSKCYRQIKYIDELPPWEETSLIQPQDLFIFEPYIYSFKLQGRDYPTPQLIQETLIYMSTLHYTSPKKMLANVDLYHEAI